MLQDYLKENIELSKQIEEIGLVPESLPFEAGSNLAMIIKIRLIANQNARMKKLLEGN